MFAARAFFVGAQANQTTLDETHANATAAAIELGLSADDLPAQAPPRYTKEELDKVGERLKELEVWMNERMEKQVPLELDKTSDPVVSSEELDERGKGLQKLVCPIFALTRVRPCTGIWTAWEYREAVVGMDHLADG